MKNVRMLGAVLGASLMSRGGRISAGIGAALASGVAAAQDYTALTSAVDWSAVQSAVMTVGVAVVGFYVVLKGVRFVLQAIKGA